MSQPSLPGFFPGHSGLLKHARVSTTMEEGKKLESIIGHELSMMDHPSSIWASNIEARYGSDPIVMKLLNKFFELESEKAPDLNSSASTTKRLKPWKKLYP